MPNSRGNNVSAYIPAFSKGAKVNRNNISASAIGNSEISAKAITSAKIRAAFLSGTLVSGKTMFAIAHGLGVVPKIVVACAINTRTQASAQNANVNVGVSAATSANIYLIASGTINAAQKYAAYVQL